MKMLVFIGTALLGGAALGQTVDDAEAEGCFETVDLASGEQTRSGCPATDSLRAPTAVIADLQQLDPSCPPPTTADEGGDCVLDSDVALDAALDLASFTTLNCRGHMLAASAPGSSGGATPAGYLASVPEVGIVIHEAYGIKVVNCVLSGFDFGINVVDAKLPPGIDDDESSRLRTKLLGNTISARIDGILLVGADNVQIAGNTIAFQAGDGLGISLVRNSDANLVTENSVTGPSNPPGYTNQFDRRIPGDDGLIGTCPNCGMITYDPPRIPLFNYRIGTLFIQFPNQPDSHPDDNVFESNTVVLPGSSDNTNHYGIALAVRSMRPIARGNTVTGGYHGVVGAGFPRQTMGVFPGTCSAPTGRYCAADSDCPGGSCSRTCALAPDVSCTSNAGCGASLSAHVRVPRRAVGPGRGQLLGSRLQPRRERRLPLRRLVRRDRGARQPSLRPGGGAEQPAAADLPVIAHGRLSSHRRQRRGTKTK